MPNKLNIGQVQGGVMPMRDPSKPVDNTPLTIQNDSCVEGSEDATEQKVECEGIERQWLMNHKFSPFFRLLAFFEVFFYLGIHAVIFVDNKELFRYIEDEMYLLLLIPFGIFIFMGAILRRPKYRVLFKRIEIYLHGTICIVNYLLILLFLFDDPFNPFIPFEFLFSLWLVNLTLIITTLLVVQLGQAPLEKYCRDTKTFTIFLVAAFSLLLINPFFIDVLIFPLAFFIGSFIIHAAMIPFSAQFRIQGKNFPLNASNSTCFATRTQKETISRQGIDWRNDNSQGTIKSGGPRFFYLFRLLLLLICLIAAWNQLAGLSHVTNGVDANYPSLFNIFLSIPFLSGVACTIVATKYDKLLVGDFILFVITVASMFDMNYFSLFAIGYAIISLILIISSCNPGVASLSIISFTLVNILGLYAFFFHSFLTDLEYYPLILMIISVITLLLYVGEALIHAFAKTRPFAQRIKKKVHDRGENS